MSIKKNGIYWKGIKRRIGKSFETIHIPSVLSVPPDSIHPACRRLQATLP